MGEYTNDLAKRRQRDLWFRAQRKLGEVEGAAAGLRAEFDELSGGLDELETYQRSMMITHLLDKATELAEYARGIASDLERCSLMEDFT